MSSLSPPLIYAITDSTLLPDERLFSAVQQAVESGISWIQYRDKGSYPETRKAQALRLKSICHARGAKLLINDDVELAGEINADGVHLGQRDTSIKNARALLGEQAIIGATCHSSMDLAARAAADGASYLAFGRFFSSNTKPQAPQAPLSILAKAKAAFDLPIVAIGGISADNAAIVRRAGADTLACCNSLFDSDDVKSRAALLTRSLNTHE